MISSQTSVDIGLIFSIVSFISVLIGIITNIKKGTKDQEAEKESLREGILKANIKLDTLCVTTTNINTDIRDLKKQIEDISKVQTEHELRISNLEKNQEK